MITSSQKKRIVGIDLGTTNSVIAILEGANPIIIPNAEGFRTTPSVVAYTGKQECLIGQLAKRQTILNSENTFSSVKRFIGCKYSEINENLKHITYTIKKDTSDKIKLYCSNLNKDFSPEEISALILKKLITDANKFLNQEINQVVITVPAYFNDSQRMGTKDAGIIAGLDVIRIINEPTAAALAYGLDKKINEIILIFDLGGGTFDVSILEVGNDVFEVLSTAGNTYLGGDDIDRILFNYIIEFFYNSLNQKIELDKQTLQRILEAAEKAKIELSTLQTTEINIPFVTILNGNPQHINLTLTRSKFEELIEPIITQCKIPVEKALIDANLTKDKINQIILVGGSTRIPMVHKLLINIFNKTLNETVNPDEVVAMGAAIQGGILAGEITDLILLDVTPLSLGVETQGGLMTPIINRNSSIPIKQTEIFSTGIDNQTSVDIHILQGERSLAKDNKSLGLFKLNDIPKAPAGIPKIHVTFQLDVNGLLSVTAREETTQKEQSIKIEGASVLSRDEITKMLNDATLNNKYDKLNKLLIIISNEFDALLFNISKITILNNLILYYYELLKELQFIYLTKSYKNLISLINKLNTLWLLILNTFFYNI